MSKTFDELYAELTAKAASSSAESRSVELLDAGVHEIGKKLVEEAAELWMAAEYEDSAQVALEASQLLYYIQLILISRQVSLTEVEEHL